MKEGVTESPLSSRVWLSVERASPRGGFQPSCPQLPHPTARRRGWSQAVGGAPGAAKPRGLRRQERGSGGPLRPRPPPPAPLSPGSGGISCARPAPALSPVACCAGRGLRAGGSAKGPSRGEWGRGAGGSGGGRQPGRGDSGVGVACPVPPLSLAWASPQHLSVT